MKSLLLLILASSAYGYTLGAAHDQLYALRNLVKFPLMIIVTMGVCAVAHAVVARFAMIRLHFVAVQQVVLGTFRDLSLLLCSLIPPNYFLARILVSTDDGHKGEYSLFLALNVLFIAIAGSLALLGHGLPQLQRQGVARGRAKRVLLMWLALTLAVGGQAAFYARPLVGLPASRGQRPPWFLGSRPDVRGATNFYEAVLQTLTNPPLPDHWGRRSE